MLCPIFYLENRAVYEIMWKSTVQPGRPQMTAWSKRITCWIRKFKNIHSEYVLPIVFPLQQWLHERSSMLRYMYIPCLVLSQYTALFCVNLYNISCITWLGVYIYIYTGYVCTYIHINTHTGACILHFPSISTNFPVSFTCLVLGPILPPVNPFLKNRIAKTMNYISALRVLLTQKVSPSLLFFCTSNYNNT